MSASELAKQYFESGYNCAQSVALAFADRVPVTKEQLLALASPFGGGMGRLRETCGAVSAMFMVTGLLYGYSTPETGEIKAELYRRVQELGLAFEARFGSLVCRELLGLQVKHEVPIPAPRTGAFYHNRRCGEFVAAAAGILEETLQKWEAEGHVYIAVNC